MNLIYWYQNRKIIYIYMKFEDNNIKLLDYIFYILLWYFDFAFKYEKKKFVSKIFCVLINCIFVTKL